MGMGSTSWGEKHTKYHEATDDIDQQGECPTKWYHSLLKLQFVGWFEERFEGGSIQIYTLRPIMT